MKNRDNNIFIAMLVALGFLALSPMAQAVVPAPDGGYPGGNTAEGQNALLSLTTGTYNTAVGIYSVLSLTDGDFCTGVGAGTLLSNTADENTAAGAGALLSNTIGEANAAYGAFALFRNTIGNSNTAIGAGTLLENIAASGNTAIGTLALANNDVVGVATAESNTAVGALALFNNIGGWENTAVGYSALASNQSGYANVAIGNAALHANLGSYNTVVGFRAGHDVDGTGNIYIGESAGIGILAESSTTRIGNGQNHCYIDGIYLEQPDPAANQPVMVAPNGHLVTPASSARFKESIKPMDKASEAILALQPVTFHYKNDANATPQFGLVAEEVARVNPDLVVPDGDGKPRSVRYEAVNAMLLNEFLKEHRKVQQLKAAMAQQKKSFEANLGKQQKQIEALTSGLEKVNAQLATASPSTVALKISNQAPQVAFNSQ
jgi:trimeric autotransporter adhesin